MKPTQMPAFQTETDNPPDEQIHCMERIQGKIDRIKVILSKGENASSELGELHHIIMVSWPSLTYEEGQRITEQITSLPRYMKLYDP